MSLDVVAGAVLSGLFASRVTGAGLPVVYWAVLALSVWVVYTADHLVDAYRLGGEAHAPRHRFAHRHFTVLALLVTVLAITAVVLVIALLGRQVLYFGLTGGLVTGLYLLALLAHRGKGRFPVPKEAVVATLYTAGVWGIPLLSAPGGPALSQWLLAAAFFLLALANTLLLSRADHDADLRDGHPSLAVTWGPQWAGRVVRRLCLAAAAIAVAAGASGPAIPLGAAAAVLLLMALATVLLPFRDPHPAAPLQHRVLAELVFWLPGLLLLL